jgi:hypothetical protein
MIDVMQKSPLPIAVTAQLIAGPHDPQCLMEPE